MCARCAALRPWTVGLWRLFGPFCGVAGVVALRFVDDGEPMCGEALGWASNCVVNMGLADYRGPDGINFHDGVVMQAPFTFLTSV